MEKISSIVPSSKRVVAVDLQAGPSVRPGVPTFGQPVGISTLRESPLMTTAEKAVAAHNKLLDKRATDQAKSVEDIAGRFFLQRMNAAKMDAPTENPDPNGGIIVEPEEIGLPEITSPNSGYVPPGTYISRDV